MAKSKSNVAKRQGPHSNGGPINESNGEHHHVNGKGSNGVEKKKDIIGNKKSSKKRRDGGSSSSSGGIGGSGMGAILWFVFLIGLGMCILDVMYFVNVLHRKHDESHPLKQHRTDPPEVRKANALVAQTKQKKLQDLNDPSNHLVTSKESEHKDDDKKPLIDLLKEAGVTYIDKGTYDELPTWTQITSLYGTEPKIYGLETCEQFQNTGEKPEHFIGTAGTFNSGTNLLSELLIANCRMEPRMEKYGKINRGIRWQVPWGKHTPVGNEEVRLSHKSKKDGNVGANDILPAVTVRDPYRWLQSMCRHWYAARWLESDHCPNLVPTEKDMNSHPYLRAQQSDSIRVNVKYAAFTKQHKSLVHMWNDWYREYLVDLKIPRIFVRYEDLLFFPKETTTIACKCAGGSMNKNGKFQYIVGSAKKGEAAHGPMSARTGYVDAIIRYGSDIHRYEGFQPQDLQFLKDNIDPNQMEIFGYKYHTINENNVTITQY